jgi:hypothetical protein
VAGRRGWHSSDHRLFVAARGAPFQQPMRRRCMHARWPAWPRQPPQLAPPRPCSHKLKKVLLNSKSKGLGLGFTCDWSSCGHRAPLEACVHEGHNCVSKATTANSCPTTQGATTFTLTTRATSGRCRRRPSTSRPRWTSGAWGGSRGQSPASLEPEPLQLASMPSD